MSKVKSERGKVLTEPMVHPVQTGLGICQVRVGWVVHGGKIEAMLGQGATVVLEEPAGRVRLPGLLNPTQPGRVGEIDVDVRGTVEERLCLVPDGLVEVGVVGILIEGHVLVVSLQTRVVFNGVRRRHHVQVEGVARLT